MDIKLIFALAAIVMLVIGYIPYLKDIFTGTTRPHMYTWLVWAITQGTATLVAFYGGADWGTVALAGGTLLVIFVFALSFRYGTKNITRSDTAILMLAVCSIFVWWQTDNPLLAVLMVSAIDGLGYIPTYRKSWSEPHTETLSFWLMMVIVTILSILSLAEINLLTATYLMTITIANALVFMLCLMRRWYIPKPTAEVVGV